MPMYEYHLWFVVSFLPFAARCPLRQGWFFLFLCLCQIPIFIPVYATLDFSYPVHHSLSDGVNSMLIFIASCSFEFEFDSL
jgi:hypothetical protein